MEVGDSQQGMEEFKVQNVTDALKGLEAAVDQDNTITEDSMQQERKLKYCTCTICSFLCHDLDNCGTNISFQVHSDSVLAALYSSEGSVMEVKFKDCHISFNNGHL
ncbi:uncharacterized protein LOC117102123 [Anneissia japonica]|uniref:uncharacterized protein LOC117102123 n=1 Tax=Anneissia japonica TaxID=1529436 RepID=UPI001425858C|nr:uncharacterized protein LOC117102123 [Anneissia japonica]